MEGWLVAEGASAAAFMGRRACDAALPGPILWAAAAADRREVVPCRHQRSGGDGTR